MENKEELKRVSIRENVKGDELMGNGKASAGEGQNVKKGGVNKGKKEDGKKEKK